MRKILYQMLAGQLLALSVFVFSPYAYDVIDKFSISGILAGAYQYQWLDDDANGADENRGRGAVNFEPEFSFRPNENNEFFAKIGFGAGNGLNGVARFNLTPWAANLENDYKDINGRNRDHLLTAWYKYTFGFGEERTLGLSGGIIDSTDYLDENAYANDEFTQFMNGALVNGANGFFPSFDIGGALEWDYGLWSVNLVGMNVGENDDGNNFHYFGAQIACTVNTTFGRGTYRLIADATSKQFLAEDGEKESLMAAIISFDQQLGDIFGAWIRFGWQDDKALIDYDQMYSGGLNITGEWYGRAGDTIGIGYVHLNGKNDVDYTRVAEFYWRFVLNDYFAATADVQYLKDKYVNSNDDIDGIIGGIRLTAQF